MLEEKNVFKRISEEADIIKADTRCQPAGFNHSRFCVTTVLLKLDLIRFIQKGLGRMSKSGL